jgi:hypothetical protein
LISAFVASYGIIVELAGLVISGVLAFVFLIMTSIYFSLDGENFFRAFIQNIPPIYKPEITALATRIRHVWEGFFRGQVTLMLIIGSVVWIGGAAIGLPFALFLGVIAGLLEIIPNLGPTLATIPAVIIALVLGPTYYEMNHFIFALLVITFYVLVQVSENSLIVPNIMGEAVDLHPILVLTGVFIGATVWGILGALIAAPTIATLKEIFGYFYYKIAWEQTTSKYAAPPEEDKGFLENIKTFFKRFRPKKPKPKSGAETEQDIIMSSPIKRTGDKRTLIKTQEIPNDSDDKSAITPPTASRSKLTDSNLLSREEAIQNPQEDSEHKTLTAILLLSLAGFLSGILLLNKSKDRTEG